MGAALGLEVDLRAVELDAGSFPVTRWISPAAYLRLSIGESVTDARRALYLDCDLIVLQDISELFALVPDVPIAAVRDLANPTLSCGPAIPGYEELGIMGSREYFNSGVMLFDLESWRAEDLGRRCARFLTEHPEHTEFWDQCALNVVVADRWVRLPLEYNAIAISPLMPALSEHYRGGAVLPLADALAVEEHARILHFAGPFKPWLEGYPAGPARDRYRSCERQLAQVDA